MNDSVAETMGSLPEARRRKRPARPDAQTDRLPPHDEKAERGVAGCVLLSPATCLDELDELGFQPEWCYSLPMQEVLRCARAMHFRQPPVQVDLITIGAELRQLGLLEQLGGYAFLNELQDSVPGAANVSYYAQIVREQWYLRTMVSAATELRASVYDFVDGQAPEKTVDEMLDAALLDLNRLSELHTRRAEQDLRAVIRDRVIPKLESHYTRGRAQMTGLVTTGLEYLDKIFCGLGGDNGNYHVIGARPNVGKTSLITGMALHAALDFEWVDEITEAAALEAVAHPPEGCTVFTGEGKPRLIGPDNRPLVWFDAEAERWLQKKKGVPVGISSLEMSADSLGFKMLFQRAQADLQLWRNGYAAAEDFPPLIKASGEIKSDRIFVDDTPRENIASIKAKWRRWHRQHGVRFFLLDYIQLIKSTQKRFRPDRVQEMEEISAEFQALGKELNCPMLILAQLNRDYEKEPNRLPRLSDLKNCGAIEQDADSVTLLYKPSPFKPFSKDKTEEHVKFEETMEAEFGVDWKKWSGRPERINALVEKNKHGPKGDAKLLFLKSSTLFVDWMEWLKKKGYAAPARGEEGKYHGHGQRLIDDADVPRNEEEAGE